MPELIAGIIAYNEEQLLPACLESIKGKVDRIVLVEGRIDTFPGDDFTSQDKTIEIAKDYGCEVIEPSGKAWTGEAEMRSQYLVGNDDDWYIFIDADEVCMTLLPKIDMISPHFNAFKIMVRHIPEGHGKYRPRLFRHTGYMEYKNIHDGLFSDGELISNPNTVPALDSIWFAHYQTKRDKLRREQKHDYYRKGYSHEPEYRIKWRMTNHD
jgi:glycosyltransferase involved in cell wall biosynthesis